MEKSKEGSFYSKYDNDALRLVGELSDIRQRIDLITTSIINLSREIEELKKTPHSQEMMDGKIATMRGLLKEIEQLQESEHAQKELIDELEELHKRGIAALVNIEADKNKAH